MRRYLLTILAALCLASSVTALEDDPSRVPHDRQPRAAITAALMNVVFLPVRLMTTFMGAELAGVTGLLTGGNVRAADDVFDLVNGSQVITPEMLDGKEHFHLSAY